MHACAHACAFSRVIAYTRWKCIINRVVVKYNCGDTTRSTTTNILLLNLQITILASSWVSLPWRRWSSVITDGWFCRGEIDDSLGFESVYSCTGQPRDCVLTQICRSRRKKSYSRERKVIFNSYLGFYNISSCKKLIDRYW